MACFDFIGDVQGQHDKLVSLLEHLGYEFCLDTWLHPDRTAVFLGNLIGEGPSPLETIHLVERMVTSARARCILGNDEFHLMTMTTADPDRAGRNLAPCDQVWNCEHLNGVRAQLEGEGASAKLIDWIQSLPLWLDFGDFRAVHACWHQPSVDLLHPIMRPHQRLGADVIAENTKRGHWANIAMGFLLKGPELSLPEGLSPSGPKRRELPALQYRWWYSDLKKSSTGDEALPKTSSNMSSLLLPPEWQDYAYTGGPLFFGHYGLAGHPRVLADNYICLDYSGSEGRPLVAYRWDGEQTLRSEKLEWIY